MVRASLAAACAAAIWAGAGWADEDAEVKRDWSWLSPGRLTPEQVVERAGKPASRWRSVLRKGTIDLNPTSSQSGMSFPIPRLVTDPKTQIEVEVLDYPPVHPRAVDDLLVFFHGRLLYAVLQLPGEGMTMGQIEERYFGDYDVGQTGVTYGCMGVFYNVVRLKSEAVALLAVQSSQGPEPFTRRVIWAGADAFSPDLSGVDWRLPPPPKPAEAPPERK